MKKYVIIVAGGKGLRMGSDLPKQFLPMGDKPVLMHTLEVFRRYDETLQIIVVLPREQQDFWKQLCQKHSFAVEHTFADGGETRFYSVKNGLALVQEPGLVGVHDGVRPFVSVEVIRRCYDLAKVQKAVIPVVDVVETLRHLTDTGSETVSRNDYKLVQTPQVFDVELLKQAYAQEFTPFFTDDASVVEAMGIPVYLAEGNRENIKITKRVCAELKKKGGNELYKIVYRGDDESNYGSESIDAFILSAGITANYKLSRNCFLLLNVNYIQPLGRFTYRKYVTDFYTGEKVERGVYKSSTFARDLNVSVGFGFPFYLGRKTNRKSPHRERTRQLMEQKRKTYGLFPGNK